MEALTAYSQNEECVSTVLRMKGNSDKCIAELLDIIYQIGDQDPLSHFNSHEFIDLFKSILFDVQQFTPIDSQGKISGKTTQQLLPNYIYRKLLVYIIINIHTFNQQQLDILYQLFISIEENAVSGYMYIPMNGRSYEHILRILVKYKLEPNYQLIYITKTSSVEKSLVICNTTLVSLIQSLQ
jgi:hypothetical protein